MPQALLVRVIGKCGGLEGRARVADTDRQDALLESPQSARVLFPAYDIQRFTMEDFLAKLSVPEPALLPLSGYPEKTSKQPV